MLSCLESLPRDSAGNNYFSSPASQGHSVDNTSTPSVQPSPTVNLTREFTLAVETHSYKEIRRIFDQESPFIENFDIENVEFFEEPLLLEQVLQPSRESIQDALSLVGSYSLAQLVGTCFEHSENTSRFYLLLCQRVRKARVVYTPIHDLLDDLPLDIDSDSYSLSQSQCTSAFNIFLQFNGHENPFVPPQPHNFDHLRQSFSQFTKKLDKQLEKTQSRVHLRHRCSKGSSLCIIAAGVGVAVAAVAIATHALVAIVASPICPIILQSLTTRKEVVHQAQLNIAAKVAYFIHKELDTIDRLVALLHSDVENDKFLVHHCVDRGMDRYLILEVLKQLRRNRSSFSQRLVFLEEHLFLCFASINRARSLLLQEIHAHQDHSP
ncbi:UPF0496 protein At3g19250-like isoform X1 [Primulina eburnea]|uniref:UPF0496 protein At3g19250-like isoform X1 n=1 Tax=Primulina eburnea TaxID=1245227 RepID=UPI003C6C5EDD